MTRSGASTANRTAPGAARDVWGHLVIGAASCVLTVSIVGSLAYIAIRSYRNREDRARILQFVGSLENRTAAELDHAAQELRRRPGLAGRVLPAVVSAARRSGVERRQLGAIRLCSAFIDDTQVQDALFKLRLSLNETIAGEAVRTLAGVRPAERAAEVLSRCLDASTQAAIDHACVGLLELGEPGLAALRSKLPELPSERRAWIAGLIAAKRPASPLFILEPLRIDADATVRTRAVFALGGLSSSDAMAALTKSLDDTEPNVRSAAAQCIGRLIGQDFGADDRGVERARRWAARQARASDR